MFARPRTVADRDPRSPSEGDARRRYVTLLLDDPFAGPVPRLSAGRVLFVCTRNAARSQFAVGLWRAITDGQAVSAGAEPADGVDPTALSVAAAHGVDLRGMHPRGYDALDGPVALVVSVCDRASEAGVPVPAPRLHWSIPDPAGGTTVDYEHAFEQIRRRIERLDAA